MINIKKCMLFLNLILFGGISQAIPITVDFDSASTGTFTSFIEDGVEITKASGNSMVWTPSEPFGSQFILANSRSLYGTSNQFFLNLTDGGEFTLESFDIGTTFNGTGWDLNIIAWNSSSYIGGDTYTDIASNIVTETPNSLSGISVDRLLFSFTGSLSDSGFAGIDNIVLNTVSVPEPSTLALLIIGIIGVAFKGKMPNTYEPSACQ